MRGTHVHGCDKLWNRIAVEGGRLDIEDCTIEDGFTALRLFANSKIRAVNNFFNGNLYSIRAGDISSPTLVSVDPSGDGIVDNDFYGDEQLIESAGLFTFPIIAILVENVSNFRVGTGANFGPNIIYGYTHSAGPQVPGGLVGLNSNLTVRNTGFL